MNTPMILGLVRHILTFAGGFLVSMGYLTEANIEAIIGAVTTLIGTLWSALAKRTTPMLPPKS